MREQLKWYDEKADNSPWLDALAELRQRAAREGYCYQHAQRFDLARYPSIRSSSRRQSPARASMMRNMRGESTSVRVARIPGNSDRRERKPCRTAMPRSSRNARI